MQYTQFDQDMSVSNLVSLVIFAWVAGIYVMLQFFQLIDDEED